MNSKNTTTLYEIKKTKLLPSNLVVLHAKMDLKSVKRHPGFFVLECSIEFLQWWREKERWWESAKLVI
jgi:hypothetical protein